MGTKPMASRTPPSGRAGLSQKQLRRFRREIESLQKAAGITSRTQFTYQVSKSQRFTWKDKRAEALYEHYAEPARALRLVQDFFEASAPAAEASFSARRLLALFSLIQNCYKFQELVNDKKRRPTKVWSNGFVSTNSWSSRVYALWLEISDIAYPETIPRFPNFPAAVVHPQDERLFAERIVDKIEALLGRKMDVPKAVNKITRLLRDDRTEMAWSMMLGARHRPFQVDFSDGFSGPRFLRAEFNLLDADGKPVTEDD